MDLRSSANNLYIYIYIYKYPEEAPHLLKYMSTIKEIHEMKEVVAFHYYGLPFQDLRNANRQPWQKPLDELYNRALRKTSNFHQGRNNALSRNNRYQQPVRPSFSRDKVCLAYNRKEYCEVSTCP